MTILKVVRDSLVDPTSTSGDSEPIRKLGTCAIIYLSMMCSCFDVYPYLSDHLFICSCLSTH